MLKIFSLLLRPDPPESDTDTTWVGDLLRHPDIARMDARELGDLPFPRRVFGTTPKHVDGPASLECAI